jgi:outer membrane protein insertion porin family
VRYRLSEDEISDVVANTSEIIRDEEGKALTSSLGFTYAFDRRNSAVDPTAGFILSISQEFAGLGGDTQFSKTQGTRAPSPASSTRTSSSPQRSRAAPSSGTATAA